MVPRVGNETLRPLGVATGNDRVTLRAFPVATPRGRSSSSHEGEHLYVYFSIDRPSKVVRNMYIINTIIINTTLVLTFDWSSRDLLLFLSLFSSNADREE